MTPPPQPSPQPLPVAIPSTHAPSSPIRSVIVMGQVPPPMNGQSLMIQEFLAGTYPGLALVHVPMQFSATTSEIGVAGVGKVLKLVDLIRTLYRTQCSTRAEILYYPPAGPNLVPVLRDIVILIICRRWFRQTVFHFHAAGLAEILPRLPWPLRKLFHLAYDRPDLAIFTTEATAHEAEVLHARSKAIVPCGTRDHSLDLERNPTSQSPCPTILFAGILCEGKGLKTLLAACSLLHQRGIPFRLVCIGSFESQAFQAEVEAMLKTSGIASLVDLPGTVTGEAKTRRFQQADIFCFPSHYTSESFGVVLIEAMSFSLPIVATRWRGIPEVTGEAGTFLVDIQSPEQLADRLRQLIESEDLRHTMGERNRSRYLERFTIEAYRDGMFQAIKSLA